MHTTPCTSFTDAACTSRSFPCFSSYGEIQEQAIHSREEKKIAALCQLDPNDRSEADVA